MRRAAPTDEQRALLRWGAAVRRDLPWRRTRDPWTILVSEVMLQQTQVARVIPKLDEFLGRWPTPTACASASLPEVLEVWSGLGYPRRAKALVEAARVVVAEHGGSLPVELADMLSLPGVGPYTARAVLAFAYERDVGVVDTNIARVLARRAGRSLRPSEAQAAADSFVPTGRSWEHNQSLMDLGAALCRPTPSCDDCPLKATCVWAIEGYPAPDPAIGSAGVSGRQARFEGSDRQGRGRLLRAVTAGPVLLADLAEVMGWPGDPARAERVALALEAEGFLERTDDAFVLAD